MDQAYEVKVEAFEGPLDLLLHLVNQYEIDIYDLPLAEITEQYLEFIQTMQQIELNIASEYLVMAADLLAIKSHMLLPKQEILEEDGSYQEDPREELIRRLIEYRKYKEAAQNLQVKELEEYQTFTRTPFELAELAKKAPVVKKGDLTVYDMLQALDKMMERKRWYAPLETTVNRVEVSIEERMEQVIQIVKQSRSHVTFDDLFTVRSKSHIVTTFLALLQLIKNKQIYCKQKSHFAEIDVYLMED